MSPRQYTLMRGFVESKQITLDDARQLSQTTLGSAVYRKWLKQKGETLVLTEAGRQAFHEYGTAAITRLNFQAALSKYIRNGDRK